MSKKMIMLKRVFHEYGWEGVKVLIYYLKYKKGFRNKNKLEWVYSRSVGHDICFRPYTTDICLMINLFCRPLDGGGIEYRIDDGILGKNPQVIIDAGANIGLFTLIYKKKYPQAQFVCIEPDEENFDILQRNVGKLSGVKCVLGGLWNADCYLRNKDRGTGEWGITVEECGGEESDCRGYSMASLMSMVSAEKIDICKMDIEGSEADVFEKNYQNWIERIDSYIIETHDRIRPGVENRIINLFKIYGYKYIRNGENIVFYQEHKE